MQQINDESQVINPSDINRAMAVKFLKEIVTDILAENEKHVALLKASGRIGLVVKILEGTYYGAS